MTNDAVRNIFYSKEIIRVSAFLTNDTAKIFFFSKRRIRVSAFLTKLMKQPEIFVSKEIIKESVHF